jgi:sulfur-oxidizing protein SoxY
MQDAIRKVVGSARVNTGRVKLDLPPLVENGNAVPLAVSVESPMTEADHVRAIHVFTEKNPQPNVVGFHLGPRAGRASVATRIRLADSQVVVAMCELSDGSFWSAGASIVVTLAACLEDGI